MKKMLIAGVCIIGLFLLIIPVFSIDQNTKGNNPPIAGKGNSVTSKYTLFAKPIDLKWSVTIGKTHYRSTIQVVDSKVVVNSNGLSYGPGGDKGDGLYVIDGKSGKVLRQIVPPEPGENDVNGLAVDNEKNVYFGTDNKRFYKTNLDGEIIWTFKAKGHVEGAPALGDLNGDGALEVVFGDERGFVYSLSTKNGALLWQVDSHEYTHEYRTSSKAFNSSPALVDLNKDKFLDILIGNRDWLLYAINGKTGEVLWNIETESGINGSPLVYGNEFCFAETCWTFYKFSIDQKKGDYWLFDSYIEDYKSFFASPVFLPYIKKFAIGSSWLNKPEAEYVFDADKVLRLKTDEKISATNLVTDLNGDKYPELWIATEGIGKAREQGKLNGKVHIVDTKKLEGKYGKMNSIPRIELATISDLTMQFPGAIEATPTIADVDGDGALELLVASLDGNLYCYSLNRTGKVYWGQFRGDNQNTGVMK